MTTAKPSSLSIWGYGCLALLGGQLVLTLVQTSTLEFWNIGIILRLFSGLQAALCALPMICIIFLVIRWFINRRKLTLTEQRGILIAPWLGVAAGCIGSAVSFATPNRRFCEEIINPMPDSVKEVKVAGFDMMRVKRWMFHFRIDPYDVNKIVWRHGLTEVPAFDFQKMIDLDPFLHEVSWARDIHYRDTALFYVRAHIKDSEDGPSYEWTYLMVDPDSSQGWFIEAYQR